MMMKYSILALALTVMCSAELYTSENDDLDIEGVVADVKTLKDFVDCFNGTGVCSEVTAQFKSE